MENIGVWKTVKIGFWLGVGFIIPQLIVMSSGTLLTVMAIPSMMASSFDEGLGAENIDESFDMSGFTNNLDVTSNISIEKYNENKHGEQLFILGSIVNNGKKQASSIQLEAELKDSKGQFVYECSEYINRKLKPGESENFQIKCGCGKTPLPEYASISVRVVGASSY